MKLVFMGTPSFAVPSLAALLDARHEVVAVFTQPDRPVGRGRTVTAPAVKRFALERGLRVEQPEKLRDPAVLALLKELAPEVIVVAAYGKILPKTLLDLPPRGAINVHGSLLPKYRGAAPIQRSILNGDSVTGITIMQMNEQMDAGDMLLQREEPIHPDDTSETLQERLAALGADLLAEALGRLAQGELQPIPQQEADVTLAPMISKQEGEIDWSRPAIEIERAVRAFHPWPGAYTRRGGRLLKILRASVDRGIDAPAGTVVEASPEGIRVACGRGSLRVFELQPEGKRRMSTGDAVSGRSILAGDRLG